MLMFMKRWAKSFSIYVVVAVLMLAVFPHSALASTACYATISPTTLPPGTQGVVQFDIQNTGTQNITWIKVQQPDANYDINGISQSGWIDSTTNTGTVLTGSTLAPSATYSFQLALQTGPQNDPPTDWIIQTSSDSTGVGAVGCSGQLTSTITTPTAAPTPNGESNIGVTYISYNSATISWTSVASSTSYVYYGLDNTYGSTATVSGYSVTHSVTLTGLSPSTIYHYKVAGTDINGNNYFSDDNTFATPQAPPPPPPVAPPPVKPAPSTGSGAVAPPPPPLAYTPPAQSSVVVPVTPNDTEPPTINFAPFADKPYYAPPPMTLNAHDNGALARLDYSTDDGRDWLPIYKVTGLSTQNATASFTPELNQDGNYLIKVRATDSNGNQAISKAQTLVIDRLPPQFGNLVVAFGSQLLQADGNESLSVAAGTVYKVTGQAVGGPTTVDLIATNYAGRSKTFSLAVSPTNGLWDGALSFENGGIYKLSVHTVDGAGNNIERSLGQVSVIPNGVVSDSKGRPLANTTVTVFYLEPSTNRWTVWDAAPYGETNPQLVSKGNYSFMVPPGQYYVQASASGYGTVLSQRFRVTSPQSLTMGFMLSSHTVFTIGKHRLSFPSWSVINEVPVKPLQLLSTKNKLIGTKLPNFNLPKINGGTLQPLDLYGRPTVLTILNTWAPSGLDQLAAMQAASTNPNIAVVPLIEGERLEAVKAYLQLAGLPIDAVVDEDNTVAQILASGFGPKHIFIDRNGRIKKVMVGVLSEEELLQELGGL